MSGKTSVTAIIRTIDRPSIEQAIDSAIRENFPILIVSDGISIPSYIKDYHDYIQLGQEYKHYGSMAINVGMLVCKTEFGLLLDDDDELYPGAGKIIREKISSNPAIDIWLQKIRFNQGHETGNKQNGIIEGNVAVPIYRTSIFTHVPFTHDLCVQFPEYTDFNHILKCQKYGFKIDFIDQLTYLVRPELPGLNGRGE